MSDPYKNQVGPPPPAGFVSPPPLGYAQPGYPPVQPSAPPGYPPAHGPPPAYSDATAYPATGASSNQQQPNFFAAAQSGLARSAMYGAGEDDSRPLQDGAGQFAFSEKSIRMAFIRKVYGILTVQLAVTIAIICMFFFW